MNKFNIFLLIIIMIIFIIFLLIIYLIYKNIKYKDTFNNLSQQGKPYLWQYWDNTDGSKTPAYINLCFKTVDQHCSDSFKIIRLNKDTILDYLPELKTLSAYNKIDKLIIAHKVDLYRIMLLKKYGGLYMDADIVVLRDPIEIIDKLQDFDYVGFGCTGNICKYGYGRPSNWLMASRKNGILISNVLNNILNKIEKQDKFGYHDLGKLILWDELEILLRNNYKYYHYHNKIDGSRDIDGYWIDSNVAFSNNKINYDNELDMMFFVVYNSNIPKNIKELSEDDILSKDWNISKFIKKSI
jgi:hypothetical protein